MFILWVFWTSAFLSAFFVPLFARSHPPDIVVPVSQSLISQKYINSALPEKDPRILRLMSWNMKHFGIRKAPLVRQLAAIVGLADVVAVQEVNGDPLNGPRMLKLLAEEVDREVNPQRSPILICYGYTRQFDRDSERYGYLWNRSRVLWMNHDVAEQTCREGGAQFNSADERQPGVSRPAALPVFRFLMNGGRDFLFSTIHLRPKKQRPEDELRPLFESYSARIPTVLAGDFNQCYNALTFQPADQMKFSHALSHGDLTSLKSSQRTLNLNYDNFFVRGLTLLRARVLNLYSVFDVDAYLDEKFIYDHISDHSPVIADFTFDF